jgi:hypothetical protein
MPILLCTFALLLALQGGPAEHRVRVEGSVVDAAGKPIAGAQVTLHAQPPVPLASEAPDRIVVRSGNGGRFAAELLLQRDYLAWAAADGGFRTPVEPVVYGRPLELRQANVERLAVAVQLVGLEAWQPLGGLGVQLVEADGRETLLPLAPAGATPLPELCGERVQLRLLHHGRAIQAWTVWLTRRGREEAAARLADQAKAVRDPPVAGLPDLVKDPPPPLELERILVPPPVVLPFEVVDRGTRAAIAGARVFREQALDLLAPPEAVSDEKGRGELVLPRPIDAWGRPVRGSFLLVAAARGYALAPTGWVDQPWPGMQVLPGEAMSAGRAPLLAVEMQPGRVLTGEMRNAKRFKAREVDVLAKLLSTESEAAPKGRSELCDHLVLQTKEGRVELHASSIYRDVLRTRLLVRLPVGFLGQRTGSAGSWVDWPLPDDYDDYRTDGKPDAPPLDLLKVRRLGLRLVLPGGRPAAFGVVEVIPRPGAISETWEPQLAAIRVRADQRGQCTIPWALPKGWILAMHDEHGVVVRHDLEGDLGPLTLGRLAVIEGQVVDAAGAPAPGAKLVCGYKWPDDPTEEHEIISAVNARALETRTDAQGRFRASILQRNLLGYWLWVEWSDGKRALECDVPAEIGTKSARLVIRLNGTIGG